MSVAVKSAHTTDYKFELDGKCTTNLCAHLEENIKRPVQADRKSTIWRQSCLSSQPFEDIDAQLFRYNRRGYVICVNLVKDGSPDRFEGTPIVDRD